MQISASQIIDSTSAYKSMETSAGIPREQLENVGRQFESVFMSMLSKQLRESVEGGLFGGENSDTYGAMFDLYMGQHLADAGGVGLKNMLLTQLAKPNSIDRPTHDSAASEKMAALPKEYTNDD